LQLKNTSLLALSSPEGNENYYSQLLNLKDKNGDPWFRVINKKMVCMECGKGDLAKQLACDHVPKTEEWLSYRKFERLKSLYANAPGTALQELAGVIVSEYTPCFNSEDIQVCFDLPRILTTSSPGIIFTSWDPSGGGPSHLAGCSAYFDNFANFVVCLKKKLFYYLWNTTIIRHYNFIIKKIINFPFYIINTIGLK
jgi:hypothetical protein